MSINKDFLEQAGRAEKLQQRQEGVKPELFAVWPFTENVCRSLTQRVRQGCEACTESCWMVEEGGSISGRKKQLPGRRNRSYKGLDL